MTAAAVGGYVFTVIPASVVQAGLQAVWAFRGGNGVGPRGAITKTLGIDTLPSGVTYSGGNLTFMAPCTVGAANGTGDKWDFSAVTNSTSVTGNGSVAIYDALFAPSSNNTSGGMPYGVEIAGDGTVPTATLGYCKFDGKKISAGNGVGVFGPWSAAIYVNGLSGSSSTNVTADHCWFTGCSYDVVKVTNATYTETNCLKNAYAWDDNNADGDGIQAISGSYTVNNCIYDVSDGHLSYPQEMNSAIFCTIDVPSNANGTPNIQNSIFYGYGLYAGGSIPFTVLSVADNHSDTTNGFNIVNGVWNNLVVQPGSNGASGYWTSGGTETSAVSIATWSNVIDFATSVTIAKPSF